MSKASRRAPSAASKSTGRGDQVAIRNRRARYDYEISETYECGIVLKGFEVKSIRLGHANLREAYARIEANEVWLHGMHVLPYEFARVDLEPARSRKLLLHRAEIDRLARAVDEKGMTIVPTKVYFSNGRVKVEIGVARGKKHYDKRESIKRREASREADRAMKEARRR